MPRYWKCRFWGSGCFRFGQLSWMIMSVQSVPPESFKWIIQVLLREFGIADILDKCRYKCRYLLSGCVHPICTEAIRHYSPTTTNIHQQQPFTAQSAARSRPGAVVPWATESGSSSPLVVPLDLVTSRHHNLPGGQGIHGLHGLWTGWYPMDIVGECWWYSWLQDDLGWDVSCK